MLRPQCRAIVYNAGPPLAKHCVNLYPERLIYFNSHPHEVVYRYRDPQLHVGENYSYLF